MNLSLNASLHKTANYILSVQQQDGSIPWFENGKLDPWDHTEAAMGLSVAGFHSQAKNAYKWLAKMQRKDGSWHACYSPENHYKGETQQGNLIETNFIAYIATGIWHYYLVTQDTAFLIEIFPCIEAAITFVLSHQSTHGEIAWAANSKGVSENDALITACSSILRSLDCACRIAYTLNKDAAHWQLAKNRLEHALRSKPERFDRTWESKARFSMDWYYPILSGIYTQDESKRVIESRWAEFVVEGLGCRCVNDEPWVTMAETCELVIALMSCKEIKKAKELFGTLQQWCDQDGGYWTGYVYRDKAIWPDEKTTWTAGAVLLAADALYQITPASKLFCEPLSTDSSEHFDNPKRTHEE